MNSLWKILTAAFMVFFIVSAASADKDVKLGGEIFTHWYYDMSDTLNAFGNRSNVDFDNYNSFEITRAYLSGMAKLSDQTYGKVTIDIEPMLNVMRLKYGYFGWKFYQAQQLKLGAKMGLVETPYISNMDKTWGRRYITMTPLELTGMQPSSDFGLSFYGKFGEDAKWGKAYLSFFNGPGYMNPDENNPTKDVDLTVFITPLNAQPDFAESQIGLQFNTGKVNAYNDSGDVADNYKKTIFSLMGDFRYSRLFNIGLEYNSYKSPYILNVLGMPGLNNFAADDSDIKVNAFTIFGGLWFGELMPDYDALQTLDLFFRYIMLDPDADDHDNIGYGAPGTPYEVKANQMIIGLECNPIEGFKTSLNFQSDKITDLGAGVDDITNSYLYLNAGLMF
jgi:hypothetical protein